jgi:hypothetical protein
VVQISVIIDNIKGKIALVSLAILFAVSNVSVIFTTLLSINVAIIINILHTIHAIRLQKEFSII